MSHPELIETQCTVKGPDDVWYYKLPFGGVIRVSTIFLTQERKEDPILIAHFAADQFTAWHCAMSGSYFAEHYAEIEKRFDIKYFSDWICRCESEQANWLAWRDGK